MSTKNLERSGPDAAAGAGIPTGKNIVVVGSGAREHALAVALARSPSKPAVSCFASAANPGIMAICRETGGSWATGSITEPAEVLAFCRSADAGLAVIGPEAPLAAGVADVLRAAGIAVLGPGSSQAMIETSKSYARNLLNRVLPEACPGYRVVADIEAAKACLGDLGDAFVVKADGLTGGKGVKVSGEHLHGQAEAVAYCRELLAPVPAQHKTAGPSQARSGEVPLPHPPVCVIEEKLEGEEFSLMTITDGEHWVHFPAVQDHKRACQGDQGPNTGGMGSWSAPDHGLPFLAPEDVEQARRMNETVIRTLGDAHGTPYRGILYGGFMATADGVRIIEYNARFGDPEALNLLTLLETDAAELFEAAAVGRLSSVPVRFSPLASVCKYAVPAGYPESPIRDAPIDLGEDPERRYGPESPIRVFRYLGSVDLKNGTLVTGGSRTAAITAAAPTIEEAEALAEAAVSSFNGPLVHRRDIGTAALIEKRINRMNRLRGRR